MMRFLLVSLAVLCIAVSASDPEWLQRKANKAVEKLLQDRYWHQEENVPKMSNYKKCPALEKSEEKPTSVHCLRWADVEVVAALGDSLTAGVGAKCRNALCLTTEYRGTVWDIGGDANDVTLPNFLRKYNPNLYGFSTGTGTGNTRLNVGVSGAVVNDMPTQARNLVNKFGSDPNVNPDDWKVVSIFIGGNNLCRCCQTRNDPNDPHSPANYEEKLEAALDILQAGLPNTFVNVMPIVDVVLLGEVSDGDFVCRLLLGSLCPCGISSNSGEIEYTKQTAADYVARTEALANLPKYSTDTFAVVSQPFFTDTDLPRLTNGNPDKSYFSPDCFHFSDKAHGKGAIALWNNMQEAVGSKTRVIDFNADPTCPTTPFISTALNQGGTVCPT